MVMEIELEKLTDYAESINVYNDGKAEAYAVGEEKFGRICVEWNGMLCGAHRMPAYGVSIHRQTVKEMERGVWAEFVFSQEFTSGGMPFEKLLVCVRPEWSGFNIVRYTAKYGYDGRCFYYDLVGKDMSGFYNVLTENA